MLSVWAKEVHDSLDNNGLGSHDQTLHTKDKVVARSLQILFACHYVGTLLVIHSLLFLITAQIFISL